MLPKDAFRGFTYETWFKYFNSKEALLRRIDLLHNINVWNDYYNRVLKGLPYYKKQKYIERWNNGEKSNRS